LSEVLNNWFKEWHVLYVVGAKADKMAYVHTPFFVLVQENGMHWIELLKGSNLDTVRNQQIE